jgi:hypothetical protein
MNAKACELFALQSLGKWPPFAFCIQRAAEDTGYHKVGLSWIPSYFYSVMCIIAQTQGASDVN